MPNGGSDNCGTCGYNRLNEGKWGYPKVYDSEKLAYCAIRDFNVKDPFSTYCINWHTRKKVPEGPIFSPGVIHESFRIPWDGNHKPETYKPGKCFVCENKYEKGINIITDDKSEYQFCTESHYVEWWKKQHPKVNLPWDYQWEKIYSNMEKIIFKPEGKSNSLDVEDIDLE